MFVIGNITVENSVADSYFACDLHSCKGACCTLPGGRGAPLEDDEVAKINGAIAHAERYLPEERREFIHRHGAVEGMPGSYATQCVNDLECVFVFTDDGVARCSLEKAFFDGRSDFRKPISCHLFPIRSSSFGTSAIRYEKIAECDAGRERGKSDKSRLYVFLKEALTRKFGKRWYDDFASACEERNGS